MTVIVVIEGDRALIMDEAGRYLSEESAARLLPRFGGRRPEIEGGKLVGFFEATYEHGNLEIGDWIEIEKAR